MDGEFNNPPHALIIIMAKKIAGIPLGQRWLTKFKARYPEIGTLKKKKSIIKWLIELKKADGAFFYYIKVIILQEEYLN